ncbi:type II secretion system F family protein [Candidatus Parcubacteria bacterium]|nr:type II secretion system F family protein [Candidatus Parcubacteria bacterium]
MLQSLNNYIVRFQRIPLSEKLFFIQHLRVMMKAGVPLARALSTLSLQSSNKKFQLILTDLKKNIEKGSGFAESLKKHSKIFGELFINIIEAGEISGKLEDALEQLFIQTKKDYEIRSKVKGAMIYPIIIVLAMIGIGGLMIIFIIPKITQIFQASGVALPMPTKILIGISDFISAHKILTPFVILILTCGFFAAIRTKKGKLYFHIVLLRLPILNKIIKKINLSRFCRTLHSMLMTDIPIMDSLKITSNVLGNVIYKQIIIEASEKVVKGINIADTLKKDPRIFPPIVTEMITVGEETGSLDNVLEEMAEFYEEEVDQTMKNLPAIIEPVLILILGVGVAGMALAVIMPMYSLTETI